MVFLEVLNTELEVVEDEKVSKAEAKLNPKPKMELFPKDEPIERKERRPKKLAPEYIFIFDELVSDLRHYKCTLIF